jgi:hypothetical protein
MPAARALTITLCRAAKLSSQCGASLPGVRVDLLLAATQEVWVSGVTDDRGRSTLSTSVPAGTSLLLQVPALGLQTALDAQQTEVTI